ncbi:hypothetical protein GCM10010919_05190 [Alishewanella longhuensis]|uniref:Sel1 repeat family protein n=1 Tax=Alishewanella longhuensis TaxID=1091037 RepID=A0ABQ3KUD6_9ALTE|nr:tetratricopeptide repeat protein [Alishewanella longhuensis]GHG61097.1 hypothetical protein GCM10010919_05190 [Alishewanella longhuensis]
MNKAKVFISGCFLLASFAAFTQTESSSDFCEAAQCQSDFAKLERFARYGSGEAATFVALAYATGEGVEQDLAKARRNIRQAARWREPMGMHQLAIWLRAGVVVPQDVAKADVWLDRAVAAGYTPAMYDKARLLLAQNDVELDAIAVALLEQAVTKHYLPATYLLAQLYVSGIGVDSDLARAAELYKAAALRDYEDARAQANGILAMLTELETEEPALQQAIQSTLMSLRELNDIEVIQVHGRQFNPGNALSNIVTSLAQSGRYYLGNTGSRIPGNLCGRGTAMCTVAYEYNREVNSASANSVSDVIRLSNF